MGGTHPTTLLIIDVQESVLVGCADPAGVLSRINDLLQRARQTGAGVMFVQHEDPDDPDMAAGSPGWQLATALQRLDSDPVLPKTYRDAFAATDLAARLAASGTKRLVVTGAHSDFCVQTTVLSALGHGFDVTLVSDAHTATAAELPGTVLDSETVVAFINRRVATLRYPGRTIEVVAAADVAL